MTLLQNTNRKLLHKAAISARKNEMKPIFIIQVLFQIP